MDTPLHDMATKILSGNEEHVKEMKKKKGIRGFFKRTWKAIKRPFHHETRVEAIVPPLLPDTPVPCTSGLQQRSVREEVISEPSPVDSGPYQPPNTSLPPVEYGINEGRDDDDLEIVSISSDNYIQQDSTHRAETEAKTSTHRKHSLKNTQEKHAKKKKKKGIRGFFKRTWKAVKRPFRHETRVEAIVPPLLPDTPVPCTSGIQQRPERLEVISEPSPVDSGPYQPPNTSLPPVEYGINEGRDDDDLEIVSISSHSLPECNYIQDYRHQAEAKTSTHRKHSVKNTQEKRAKGIKKKGIRGFFKRTWKVVKRPFHHKTKVEAVVPPLLPDTPVPCTSSLQQRPETEEVISEPSPLCIPYQLTEHKRMLCYCPVNWYKAGVISKPKKPFRQRFNVLKKLKEKKKRRDDRKINDAVIKGVMEFHERNKQYSFNRPRPRNQDPNYSGPPGIIMGYILCEPSIQSIPEPGPLSVAPLFKQSDGSHQSFYKDTDDFVGVERSGYIFGGIRKSDGHKVALKYVDRFKKLNFYQMAGYLKPLMNEVAMLCLMQQPPISPYVIQMFEWFEDSHVPVIVLEDCRPYTLLSDLIDRDAFDERTASIIMRQVVLAAKHCIAHGVFYAEINPRNILVNTSTWEIKLTDFSCALPYTAHEYLATDYKGHKDYASLECLMDGCFRAFTTNVWQLGLLLTELVFGCYYTDKPKKLPVLSNECLSLIKWCRREHPERRPTFDQILQHRWFTLD